MFGPCFLPVALDDIPHVAVAIGRAGRNDEYVHAAVFFRRADRQLSALDFDLAGNISASDPATSFPRYAWAIPQLPSRILPQFAALCESIAERPRRFTYQFAFHENVRLHQENQDFVIDGGTEGFTCATFVLALFQTRRFPLAKLDTWTLRPEDEKWQKDTLDLLRGLKDRLGLSTEALQRRAAEIPCLRFSPSDVIGTCRVGSHPTACEPARQAGDEVLNWIDTILSMVRYQ